MKYIVELISIVNNSVSFEEKHKKVIEGLKVVPSPWGIGDGEFITPSFGNGLSAIFKLNKFLRNSIKGEVIYTYRGINSRETDDRIYLEFNPIKINFNELINTVFKQYIDFFDPTEASIFNKEIVQYDYENRDKYDLTKFIRFYQVFFWNQSYCEKKLGLSLLEFKNKISNHVERVELFKDGIIVIASSKLLTLEESNDINLIIHSVTNKLW